MLVVQSQFRVGSPLVSVIPTGFPEKYRDSREAAQE